MPKIINKSIITGILFCASLIVLIYTMLEFRKYLPAVLGASIFFLVMTGIAIYQAGIAVKTYQKKQTMLLESRLAELQNQITTANDETRKAAKTNTYYTKKIGEALADFEDELIDNQRKGNMLMQRMITAQTKSTKVLVKYNQINTNKVVSNVHNQYHQIEQSLDHTMNNTNVELRRIGENIMMIQKMPQPAVYQPMPQMTPEMLSQMAVSAPSADEAPKPIPEQPHEVPEEMNQETFNPVSGISELTPEPISELMPDSSFEPTPEPISELMPDSSSEPTLESISELISESIPDELLEAVSVPSLSEAESIISPEDKPLAADIMAAEVTEDILPAAEPVLAVDIPDDPNAQLSPDQIAALFAAANG